MTEDEKYNAFTENMHSKYPKMFAEPYGGFCTGEGWWPLIELLCDNIQDYIDWKNRKEQTVAQVTINQIKEKFGGLRFYYSGGDDQISGMVRIAEAVASITCETCGAPGKSRGGGWIQTLCDEHAKSLPINS
jgi:hypothetical protein